MTPYKSNISTIAEGIQDMTLPDIAAAIGQQCESFFEDNSITSGFFQSEEDRNLCTAVAMYIAQDENPQILEGEKISKDEVDKLRNEQRVRISCEYYKSITEVYHVETMEELDKLLVQLEHILRDNLGISPGELEFRVKQKLEKLAKENREFVSNLKKEIVEKRDEIPRINLRKTDANDGLGEILKKEFGSYGVKESQEKPGKVIPFLPKKL